MAYPIPNTGIIPFNLTENKEIIVEGVAPVHAGRFSINLCSGPTYDTDTALHFNPRFDQNEVVRTHYKKGWGDEEKDGGFPFYKGGAFEVKIIVRRYGFTIFVNNKYFCDFNHRIPKETARFLYIDGDVTINKIEYLDVIRKPPVPLTTFIYGGLYPGKKIVIDGRAHLSPSRFNVNLMCGPKFHVDDVALHFDVRFNYLDSRFTVVRNHKADGGWGAEEKHCSYFPFFPNRPFEILILVESHGFKISVNKKHFVDFNHRLHPLQRIDYLEVHGDVALNQVKFLEPTLSS